MSVEFVDTNGRTSQEAEDILSDFGSWACRFPFFRFCFGAGLRYNL
jgi:hypothetical protein